jgi:uncharacterized YigZ family protein
VEFYTTLRGSAAAELVEKRSRFIALAAPAADEAAAMALLETARAKHRDARHHVWAYLLRSGARRFSDDGEPQGTGGAPVLDTLVKSGLCDCAVVVTRFFGGVLLGAGGLVRAYSGAARLALAQAQALTLCEHVVCAVHCEYHQLGRVTALAGEFGVLLGSDYAENITLRIALPLSKAEDFEKRLTEATSGSVLLERIETVFMEADRNNL